MQMRSVPAVQALDLTTGTFLRESVAYVRDEVTNTLVQKTYHTPRTVAITTCSPSDGQVHSDLAVDGFTIIPRAAIAPYVYAVGHNGTSFKGVYRTSDGTTWTRVDSNNPGPPATFGPEMIFVLPEQNVLIADQYSSGHNWWYYSADNGVTWANGLLGGGTVLGRPRRLPAAIASERCGDYGRSEYDYARYAFVSGRGSSVVVLVE